MNRFRRVFFGFLVWVLGVACFGQTSSPVTLSNDINNETWVTLGGVVTRDWTLKLDHPLDVFNRSTGQKFEAKELEMFSDDCKNCDKNWTGSRVQAYGVLDQDSHDPQKGVIWVEGFEGTPQPVTGPLYLPYESVRLKGRLFLMKCEKGEGPILKLDPPINVAKGGEFEGPAYGVTAVQPVGVDVGKGLREGPAEITGTLDYELNEGSPYESHLCLEASPTIVLHADSVTGAKDQEGNPIGVKVVYFNPDRSLFLAKDGERTNEDFKAIRDASEKNDISFRGENKMKCAYRFVCGAKTMTIPLSQQNDAYPVFAAFFNLK